MKFKFARFRSMLLFAYCLNYTRQRACKINYIFRNSGMPLKYNTFNILVVNCSGNCRRLLDLDGNISILFLIRKLNLFFIISFVRRLMYSHNSLINYSKKEWHGYILDFREQETEF